jgi:hypothetical protein
LAGADSTWNGLENSLTITGQTGHTESAAQLCLEYVNGGCDTISVTYRLNANAYVHVSFVLDGQTYNYDVPKTGELNGKNEYSISDVIIIRWSGSSWDIRIYGFASPATNYTNTTDYEYPIFNSWTYLSGTVFDTIETTAPEPVTVEVDSSDVRDGRPTYTGYVEGIPYILDWKDGEWRVRGYFILESDGLCPFGVYTVVSSGIGIFEAFEVAPVNPKNDWYLPAIDELSLLWQNRFNVNRTISRNSSLGPILGATHNGYNTYWSSTEYDSTSAWYFYFLNGVAKYNNKNDTDTYYVRAVRKFSI